MNPARAWTAIRRIMVTERIGRASKGGRGRAEKEKQKNERGSEMGKGYERVSEIRSGELAKDKRGRGGREIGSEKERGAKHMG